MSESSPRVGDVGGSRFIVGCSHREVNDRNPRYDGLALLPVDDQQQRMFDEGLEFEDEVFLELARLHKVSSMRLSDDPEAATLQAMARGDKVIIGASLPIVDHRGGRPDVLVRHGDAPMSNGKWAYLPVDVKNSKPLEGDSKAKVWMVGAIDTPWLDDAVATDLGNGKAKTDHSLQLAHYWLILRDLGHAPAIDPIGATIASDKRVVWRLLDDGKNSFIAEAQAAWDERWAAIDAMRNGEERHTRPVYRDECKKCRWHDVCESELIAEGHVSLVSGVGVIQVRKLAEGGIETIPQLAALDPVNVDANPVPKYAALGANIDAARVYLRDDGRPYFKRGAAGFVVPRADIEIDFDIENDDIVYMYGLHVSERIDEHTWTAGEYLSFHTYDRSDVSAEGRLLADFWHWLHDTVADAHSAGRTVAVYCYSGGFAEIPRMKEASARNAHVAGVPSVDEIGALPSNDWWVDMHEIAKQLHWPSRTLGLKALAPMSGFAWDADDASGANSIIWYRAACDTTNPDRAVMGAKLLRYNTDDVLATRELRRWLHDGVHGRGWNLESVETLTG